MLRVELAVIDPAYLVTFTQLPRHRRVGGVDLGRIGRAPVFLDDPGFF